MVFYLKSDLSAIGREDIDRGVEKFLELCVPEQSRYDSEELLPFLSIVSDSKKEK